MAMKGLCAMKDAEEKKTIQEVLDHIQERNEDGKGIVLARDVLPGRMPVLPLEHRPLFPKMLVPMMVRDPQVSKMINAILETETHHIGLFLRKKGDDAEAEGPPPEDVPPKLHKVGVIAEIQQIPGAGSNDAFQIVLNVLERASLKKIIQTEPFILADVDPVVETEMAKNDEIKAYSMSLIKSLKELMELNPLHQEELKLFMSQADLSEPFRLADLAANLTSADAEELQAVLEARDVFQRLSKALLLVKKEIDLSKIQVKINKQIEEKISKQQRDFFLREQLKAIKKELGIEKEGKDAEIERFEKRIAKCTLTDEARERIDEELEKLKLLEPASPEFHVTRTYLDWLTVLPWGIFTRDSYNLKKAQTILDRDHFGLDDVKERILEFLAVGIQKGNIAGSILCFAGPPGVGKTSIGRSIAESIGRNFYRFSVGGIRDEAEIKGHRRTYIGALPGKFIQSIKTCKSANPVIMLDEIDKIGASYRGDPASALLEVLDPEQNQDFLDHYLDVRFDLSNVFFICTANQLDTIPKPLLDRMELINIAGYINREKLAIGRHFLVPKQFKAHNVTEKDCKITQPALKAIIEGYAREPGVRDLEKRIQKIVRKAVKKRVKARRPRTIKIDVKDLEDYLGKPVFTDDSLFKTGTPGVVTGLAWTSMGGDVLTIEATGIQTGKPGFKQTGQLGDVMVESSEIAYSHVRAIFNEDGKSRDFFGTHQIHLHVPAGATPKDGPSAGITMACALYSLATGKAMKAGFAMTGELTLVGRVMPVGGIKEKVIAAKRNRIKHLILPRPNKKDYDELPDEIRKGFRTTFVDTFEDVVAACIRTR